jgi:hypothetical protein
MANFIQFKDGIPQNVKDKAKYILEQTHPNIAPEEITDDLILNFIENYLIHKYNRLKREEITKSIDSDISDAMIPEHDIFSA